MILASFTLCCKTKVGSDLEFGISYPEVGALPLLGITFKGGQPLTNTLFAYATSMACCISVGETALFIFNRCGLVRNVLTKNCNLFLSCVIFCILMIFCHTSNKNNANV